MGRRMADRWGFHWLTELAAAFAVSASMTAVAVAATESDAVVAQPAPPAAHENALDRRVRLLARELDLNARQQGKLREILEEQREAVQRVWSDNSLLPAERAPATREIGERTADRIRSLLTDEQRKHYNPPRPTVPHESSPDVSKWMTAS